MTVPFHVDDALEQFDSQSRLAYRFEPERPARAPDPKPLLEAACGEDELLVRRIRAGDPEAFAELVRQYQARVSSLIWGILRDPNHVEDVAQQVFAKVFFSIGQFDCRSSLYTWIHKITVNECYDFLRKKRVRKIVNESETTASEDQPSPLENAVDASQPVEEKLEQRDFVLRLLEELPPEDRSLLLMKEVDGYSVEELAAMTGMNENTVKVRLFRARKRAARAARRLTRPASSIVRAEQSLASAA